MMPATTQRIRISVVSRSKYFAMPPATLFPLDRASQVDPACNSDLDEDIAHVGLHRFLAEEQLRGDLRVRPSIDHEMCHLEPALGERRDARGVHLARPRAAVGPKAESSQLSLRGVPVAKRAARVERPGHQGNCPD